MGFIKNLFRKFRGRWSKDETEESWEQLVYARDRVDFKNEEQRSRYVTDCLEQIAEASREIDLLTGEYSLVTSYLTDMEEIEALPQEDREDLNIIARKLVTLEQERQRYRGKKNRMSDKDYYQMRKQEEEVQEGIKKIREAEEYGALVKQDMKRLDSERHAHEFRRAELEAAMMNMRGMAVIFLTAFVVCMVMLLILQFGFEMDTRLGMLMAVGAAAIALTVLCVRFLDSDRESITVANAINRLIQLQNKVKIRYVNNRSLVDYYYMKYGTESAAALEKKWTKYQQEKEERKQYAEAEAQLEFYQKELVDKLSNYRVGDPDRWMGQPGALLDKREMVEIRHNLILRRQSLRKQMDYNNNVAERAQKEIKEIVKQYPIYAPEILDMVDRYDRQG